jgi:AraC-like DNA-binding protein
MESSRKNIFWWGPESSHDLYVRSCGDFVLVPPDRERIRSGIDFAEIFWPISGECSFSFGGRQHIVHPGEIFYYPPGSCHDYKPLSPFHYCWMTLAGDDAAKFIDLLGIKPGCRKAGSCPQELFAALGKDCIYHSVKHRINALTIAFRILLQIAFEYKNENKKTASSMDFAKKMIDTNFDDPDLSVNSLAMVLRMHRASFSRAFRKAFAVTVTDYISYVRLQNAMQKLEQTNLSIRETAESCGFSSANYFSKVFIAQTGITPSQYRTQTGKMR